PRCFSARAIVLTFRLVIAKSVPVPRCGNPRFRGLAAKHRLVNISLIPVDAPVGTGHQAPGQSHAAKAGGDLCDQLGDSRQARLRWGPARPRPRSLPAGLTAALPPSARHPCRSTAQCDHLMLASSPLGILPGTVRAHWNRFIIEIPRSVLKELDIPPPR